MTRRNISPVPDGKQKAQAKGLTEDNPMKGLHRQADKSEKSNMKWCYTRGPVIVEAIIAPLGLQRTGLQNSARAVAVEGRSSKAS